MQHAINVNLWQFNGRGGFDMVGRGSVTSMYGVDCCYVGPAPDGSAYFWIGPGDCRCVTADGLASQGLALVPSTADILAYDPTAKE